MIKKDALEVNLPAKIRQRASILRFCSLYYARPDSASSLKRTMMHVTLECHPGAHDLSRYRRRRRRRARRTAQGRGGDGGRRRGRETAACRRGVDGDAAARARGAYAARGQSKSRRRLDVSRDVVAGKTAGTREPMERREKG